MIFFLSKESKSEKKILFEGGEGKGGLASISEFALQRIQIEYKSKEKKKYFFFFFFFVGGGGGGGGRVERGDGLSK